MKFYVGVTDNRWFDVVSHIPPDWKPSIQQGKHYDTEEHTLPALEAASEDSEPFEKKMRRQTKQLQEQFAEGKRLEDEIRKNLKGLGHGI